MDLQAEAFVGVWDVYSGPMHCELMLMPDGTYRNTLWGGVQMHWGRWSLREVQGHIVLHFELDGAQPDVHAGPFGPIPMNWPSAESWVIIGAQVNQVAVYGGMMLRRQTLASIPRGASAQMPEVSAPTQFLPGSQGAPDPSPEAPPTAPIPAQVTIAPPPIPAQFAPAPPPPAPDPHWAEINRQWQDLHSEMIKSAQAATFKRSEIVHQGNQKFLDYLKS